MKGDDFIAIQKFKKRISIWRAITIIVIFFYLLSLCNKIIKNNIIKRDIIARVKIRNFINNDSFSKEKLEYLKNDRIKAIILDIDSSGGDVVASEILYTFFRKLSIDKPVISQINGVGASGAYLLAMASDYIIAYNTSIVGSIGVMMQSYEITELADKIGISLTNFKSSALKAAPNPFEKITPDVDMVVNQEVNDIYDYFLTIFIQRRKIKPIEAQEIANGQIYTGRQALEYGLIDKIGGDDEVIEYFKDINIDMDKVKIVDFDIYKNSTKFNSILSSFRSNIFKNKIQAIYKKY